MSDYRRHRRPGAAYFFTENLAERRSALLIERIGELRAAVRQTRREKPFRIDAWVVLPDHIHAIWTLPAGDADYSTRWAAIKGRFSARIRRAGFTRPPGLPVVQSGRYAGVNQGLRRNKDEVGIW